MAATNSAVELLDYGIKVIDKEKRLRLINKKETSKGNKSNKQKAAKKSSSVIIRNDQSYRRRLRALDNVSRRKENT